MKKLFLTLVVLMFSFTATVGFGESKVQTKESEKVFVASSNFP